MRQLLQVQLMKQVHNLKALSIVGSLVGLVGGAQIYIKWNNGDQDVTKRIVGWGGACLFLVATGSILKVLFL